MKTLIYIIFLIFTGFAAQAEAPTMMMLCNCYEEDILFSDYVGRVTVADKVFEKLPDLKSQNASNEAIKSYKLVETQRVYKLAEKQCNKPEFKKKAHDMDFLTYGSYIIAGNGGFKRSRHSTEEGYTRFLSDRENITGFGVKKKFNDCTVWVY